MDLTEFKYRLRAGHTTLEGVDALKSSILEQLEGRELTDKDSHERLLKLSQFCDLKRQEVEKFEEQKQTALDEFRRLFDRMKDEPGSGVRGAVEEAEEKVYEGPAVLAMLNEPVSSEQSREAEERMLKASGALLFLVFAHTLGSKHNEWGRRLQSALSALA